MKKALVFGLFILSSFAWAINTNIQKGDVVAGVPAGTPIVYGTVLDFDGKGSAEVFNTLTNTKTLVAIKDLAKTQSCSDGRITAGASVMWLGYGAAFVQGVYENGDLLLRLRGNYRRVLVTDITLNGKYVPKVNYCEL